MVAAGAQGWREVDKKIASRAALSELERGPRPGLPARISLFYVGSTQESIFVSRKWTVVDNFTHTGLKMLNFVFKASKLIKLKVPLE